MLYYYYVAEIPDDGVYFPPEKGHQSTIVGRLYDNASGEYVYILRNTWGVGACTCLQKAYALSLPSLRDDVINAFCADPVRSQSKLLSDMAASVYASNKEKYNSEVPFSCDNGYFLIKKSALKQNLYNIAYYLPVKKLPKPEKP
jgi:hypothetical protein